MWKFLLRVPGVLTIVFSRAYKALRDLKEMIMAEDDSIARWEDIWPQMSVVGVICVTFNDVL